MNSPVRLHRHGFSLLEILIAFIIFAIAMGGIMVSLGNNISNSQILNDYSGAIRLAQWKMDELRNLGEYSEDEIAGEEGKYSWVAWMESVSTEDMPMHVESDDQAGNFSPALLSVEVTWKDFPSSQKSNKFLLQGYKVLRYEPK